jgi:hypothetical protein
MAALLPKTHGHPNTPISAKISIDVRVCKCIILVA